MFLRRFREKTEMPKEPDSYGAPRAIGFTRGAPFRGTT